MDQHLMTLKEIAQKLGLPESTLRKYRDAYPQFMPYVGTGRERRYREGAVEVFNAIREYRVDRHLSWEDTEKELTDRFPINPDEIGKKAVVSENEANIFLERLEKWVKQLSSQAERQEFVSTTLATELLKIRQLTGKLDPMAEDLKVIRRSSYSYNEVVQRQFKETQKNLLKMMELMVSTQGSIGYISKEIENKVRTTPVPASPMPVVAPAPPPSPAKPINESAQVASLREELRQKTEEAEKFRDLFVRAKREIERLRAELKKQTIDDLYGDKKEHPEKETKPVPPPAQKPSKGGMFLFGKKK
jgi:DNA-binding transcriptional MerR regulator